MSKKRFLSLILALLIMSTRVGFALNVHYCGYQIAKISLASNPSDCGMEIEQEKGLPEHTSFSKTPCCKDQTLLFQNSEPQKVETKSKVVIFSLENIPQEKVSSSLFVPVLKKVRFSKWSPPLKRNNKIFLLNHSFVFYG
jgi:hypothetical protein